MASGQACRAVIAQSCTSAEAREQPQRDGTGKVSKSIQIVGGPEDFAAAFNVSRETIERLTTYEALLRQWQKAVNLVAPGTLDAVWHRHFADSAQLLPLAPPGPHHWIDLGSGAGFPGLVVAILLAERTARLAPPLPVSVSSPLAGRGTGEGGTSRTSKVGVPPTPNPSPLPRHAFGTMGRGTAPLASGRRTPRVTLIESDTRKAAFLREVIRKVRNFGGGGCGRPVDKGRIS